MKKYTILDSTGQKKIVYAPNMKKALRYVGDGEKTVKDSKVKDESITIEGDWSDEGLKAAKKMGLTFTYTGRRVNGLPEAKISGNRQALIKYFKEWYDPDFFEEGYDVFDSVKDSIKDEDDYFYFDADEDDRSLDDYKRIMKQCGLTITKVEGNNREAFIYYRGSSSAEQKAARMLGISLDDSVKDSKVKDIDVSSLMTLFTKYGKPYGYVCKERPKMSSSASKYLGQLVSYTLSPIGKYDIDKARNFVDFLNKKGYEALIFAPNIVVTLKQDRSSGLYNRGHERTNQYDSKVKDAGLKTYKTIDYYAENGYYKVYVKNRNKNGDQPIKHLAEALGLKTSPMGYFTKDRIYAPPYAKEYLVEGTNKDAIIKFCETLDPKLAPLKGHIKDDTNRSKTFKFFINNRAVSENEYIKYFIEEAANEHQSSTTAKRVINENKEDAKDSGKNTFMFESGRKFSIVYDSIKDADANIVDKLISEEEKAVMDYKEALMADSDLSANAVYAHILAEELEHLRELRSLREQPSLGDSIKDAVQTAETYANTGWIEKLASDLLNEGQKNGYDFDAVLKKFDSLSKQILVIVKNALDKAKKEVVDYKSRY